MDFDLVIRDGNVVTATEEVFCDIGVKNGRIAAIGERLPEGEADIDADGNYVFPGGIDSHTHIEQLSSSGIMCADDFYTGTVSAAHGGTTTILSFAAQHKGDSLRQVLSDYHQRAKEKAVIDYSFHLIISDPTETVMKDELPELIRNGYTSFKVYMTYDALRLDDYQMLDVFSLARREGALTMVHAENHDLIRWVTERLLSHGAADAQIPRGEPPEDRRGRGDVSCDLARRVSRCAVSHRPRLRRRRHGRDPARTAARSQSVFAETCPQYLFSHGRRPRPARDGGGDVLLQPAAAR